MNRDYPSYPRSPPPSQSHGVGASSPGLEMGLVLGRMLAAQDKQIQLLERIEWRLQHLPVEIAEKSQEDKKRISYQDVLYNIRQTAYALLPVMVIALIVMGKLTMLEGWGIIKTLIPGSAPQ